MYDLFIKVQNCVDVDEWYNRSGEVKIHQLFTTMLDLNFFGFGE
jgi:hypothetical protein